MRAIATNLLGGIQPPSADLRERVIDGSFIWPIRQRVELLSTQPGLRFLLDQKHTASSYAELKNALVEAEGKYSPGADREALRRNITDSLVVIIDAESNRGAADQRRDPSRDRLTEVGQSRAEAIAATLNEVKLRAQVIAETDAAFGACLSSVR